MNVDAAAARQIGALGIESARWYQRQIKDGAITACELTRLAVQRSLDDELLALDRGFYLDEAAAARIIGLFAYFRHVEGRYAGNPILLEPWQCWQILQVYGWRRVDNGRRRFKTVYESVGRKNGKTTKIAPLCNIHLLKDGEAGPQVYTAANSKEQANIAFTRAKVMGQRSPAFARRLEFRTHYVKPARDFGIMRALASDTNVLDGFNPSFVPMDEVHAAKDGALWGVIETGMNAREQPLMWALTTAGYNPHGFCKTQLEDYLIKILKGEHLDDSFFGVIYTLDDGDDPLDEAVWPKANPNIHLMNMDALRSQATKAAISSTAHTDFVVKQMNCWQSGEIKWAPMTAWKRCQRSYDLSALKDAVEVYAGVDLGIVGDMSALAIRAYMPDNSIMLYTRCWLPEDTIRKRLEIGDREYYQWVNDGWLIATDGNVCDEKRIIREILDIQTTIPCGIREIGYDRYNASKLVSELMDAGMEMIPVAQTTGGLNAGMRAFEREILGGLLVHDGNAVMTWSMGNVISFSDTNGNIKPNKKGMDDKIDAPVAHIIASARAQASRDAEEYLDDDLLDLIVV